MVRLTLLLVSSREECSRQWDAEFPREGTLISTYAEQVAFWGTCPDGPDNTDCNKKPKKGF